MKFTKTCCAFSKDQLENICPQHGDKCPDNVLKYVTSYKDKYVNLSAGFRLVAPNAVYEAKYCPSCGKNLKKTCIPETP